MEFKSPAFLVKFQHHPMFLLDKWGHKLHLPRWIRHRICNAFDRWVGLYDNEEK